MFCVDGNQIVSVNQKQDENFISGSGCGGIMYGRKCSEDF